MTKRRKELHVTENLDGIFNDNPKVKKTEYSDENIGINKALNRILRQLKAVGYRPRTLEDYYKYVSDFMETTQLETLHEITNEHIYDWLSSMNVSNQTKLTRLKALKAFLGHCKKQGWFDYSFWTAVNIKVEQKTKKGATDEEVFTLLRLLDLTKFVELRDATAILTMYTTGIRVGTLAQLENKHLDIIAKTLKIDGGIIKNHKALHLPISDELAKLFTILKNQNDMIRKERKKRNENLFITQYGDPVDYSQSHNLIQKRINYYMREYGFKNLSPHALRRGFAKNLLNKGANIALISKALGHSNIDVTTRYLHLEIKEVEQELREFL